jgi:hypothetical protein
VFDVCGVCNGDGIIGHACDCEGNIVDCAGVCGGSAELDECGMCGGNGIAEGTCDCDGNVLDCAGECGGALVLDACGVCGDAMDAIGCDCSGGYEFCANEMSQEPSPSLAQNSYPPLQSQPMASMASPHTPHASNTNAPPHSPAQSKTFPAQSHVPSAISQHV